MEFVTNYRSIENAEREEQGPISDCVGKDSLSKEALLRDQDLKDEHSIIQTGDEALRIFQVWSSRRGAVQTDCSSPCHCHPRFLPYLICPLKRLEKIVSIKAQDNSNMIQDSPPQWFSFIRGKSNIVIQQTLGLREL